MKIAMIFAPDGTPAFADHVGHDESNCFAMFLGWPTDEEVKEKKAAGYKYELVEVVRHNNGNDDAPNTRLGGATDPVPDRGGLGGAQTERDNQKDAGEMPGTNIHGVPVQSSEEGPSAEVRLHPSGDDTIRDSVESNAEDIRGGLSGTVISFSVHELPYRHIIRGTEYYVLSHSALLQCDDPRLDNSTVIVYIGKEDGRLWVRFPREFFDGRFTK